MSTIPEERVTFGRNMYTKKIAGDLPVIISAPHGGHLRPKDIANRQSGLNVKADRGTALLGICIVKTLFENYGKYPYCVQCRLYRRKLDVNREIKEATDNNPDSEPYWHEYHQFINECIDDVLQRFGKGFYFDIHGHGHKIQRVELGYNLSASTLRGGPEVMNSEPVLRRSSVYSDEWREKCTHRELVCGSFSSSRVINP